MTQSPAQRQGDPGHRKSEPGHRKSEPDDKEFMTTLAKGLAVLGAFGRLRPTMTLSEAAGVADLSRATARRVLRTLTQLGYVAQDGRTFSLAPKILELGFAYLSTQSWIDRALPLMRELSERLGESCSAAILQGNDIVYVARVPARRIMSAALSVGSRLPALHTALGRVLFGYLDEAEIWRRLMSQRIEAYTPQTITDPQALFDRIHADRAQHFSIVDEELELGLRALAVPVLDRGGQAVGAINLSTHSTRTTRNDMREHFLPELNRIAGQVSSMTV
ncbi:IclR family transcriptional regulator C-terminal domain-containing protein [Bradyrhizobium lablabi]|uniref:IclR family transcriptional regulator domain-containing protein n=1 Tax=Bradyrhizobium lablabi TaxID=722472 RepID=UPI001BADF99E|nr:IclR family transcriptional regulator C-terminal domain-containing protein [Bradyrhizobium lablabi]MBR0693730.1 helix-turn-helix domain-containing protein [Bradyrhizobium lablabi]